MKSLTVTVTLLALGLSLAGCGGGGRGSQIVERIKTAQGYTYIGMSHSKHGSSYCIEQRVSGRWEHFANGTAHAKASPGRCPPIPGVS